MQEYAARAPFWYAMNTALVMLGAYWLLDPVFQWMGMGTLEPRGQRIFVSVFAASILTVFARGDSLRRIELDAIRETSFPEHRP